MKWIALVLLISLQCACETAPTQQPMTDQYNRRDLYSPEPESGSTESSRQVRQHWSPTPEPKPQFRG